MGNKEKRIYSMTKLEYVARTLSKGNYKDYETYVINAIYQKVNNPELHIETQKGVRTTNCKTFKKEIKLIDLYLPQLHIAVEIDEKYHQNDIQKLLDKERESSIQEAIIDDLDNKIQFERIEIPYENYGLEELNKRIDEVVEKIKLKIAKLKNLKWYFGQDFIKHIKETGRITQEDSFYQNYIIINLICGKNYKGWQQAYYEIKETTKEGYSGVWFPVIFEKEGKSTNSWVNTYNEGKSIIYEKSNDKVKQSKKKNESIDDYNNKKRRIVFAKERDQFGKLRKRFVGVFVADGWDDKLQAERWKLNSTELKIPIQYV